MPVVIPVIAAFASGAVAAVVAGTATFAAYAAVAGAVLSVAGAITGNKDLQRIGGIVGIVGGAASLFSGGASAASTAGSAAESAGGITAEQAAYGQLEAAAADGATAAAGDVAGMASPSAAAPLAADINQSAAEVARLNAAGTPLSKVAQAAADAGIAGGITPQQSAYSQLEATTQVPGPGAGPTTPIADIGKQYNSLDLKSWWDKAEKAGKGVGSFIKDNKELVQLAGGALKDMYGPEAEALELQRSLMERARRNINTPIALQYKPGG